MGEEVGKGWRKERGPVDGRREETPSVVATLLLQLPGPQACLTFLSWETAG